MNSYCLQLWEIVEPFFNQQQVTREPNSSFETSSSSNTILYSGKDYCEDVFPAGCIQAASAAEKHQFKPNNKPSSSRTSNQIGISRCYSLSRRIEQKFCREANKKEHVAHKRTRSAEMHKIYERKRRDRINGKMKALQELIPYSFKADKASILDDAVAYIKSLKMQNEVLELSLMNGGATWQVKAMSETGSSGALTPNGQYVSMCQSWSEVNEPPPLQPSSANDIQFSAPAEKMQPFNNGLFSPVTFPSQEYIANANFPE